MTKQPPYIPFWQSTSHLYGCYGGILMCILVICSISNLGWFGASFWGYILGRIFYWIQSHFVEETFEKTHEQKPIQVAAPVITAPLIEKSEVQEKEASINKDQQLLSHFLILKQQVEGLLPTEAKEKFQEIQALLVILSRKLQNTKDFETRCEIQKVQRLINNYLEPTLQHYQELPVLFHERKLDQGQSPNEMMLQQFTLVHEELLQITEHVFQDDLNGLVQHGIFLEQKFRPPQFFKVGINIEVNQ